MPIKLIKTGNRKWDFFPLSALCVEEFQGGDVDIASHEFGFFGGGQENVEVCTYIDAGIVFP